MTLEWKKRTESYERTWLLDKTMLDVTMSPGPPGAEMHLNHTVVYIRFNLGPWYHSSVLRMKLVKHAAELSDNKAEFLIYLGIDEDYKCFISDTPW